MKFMGRGKVGVSEVVTEVKLTPVDIGTFTDVNQSKDATISVQTNLGTRNPKTVTGLKTNHPNVTARFVPPNIVRVTLGSPTSAVSGAFEFEGDAT